MPNIFDGFSGSANWLDDFITSEAALEISKETVTAWEEDVIKAVKTQRYSNLEEALADMRQKTGLTDVVADDIKNGIIKKTAFDKQWHSIHNSTSKELLLLKKAKMNLVQLANQFDDHGEVAVSNAIDEALDKLPDA